MNWRNLLFWKRDKKEPELFPSQEELALEDANKQFLKLHWLNGGGPLGVYVGNYLVFGGTMSVAFGLLVFCVTAIVTLKIQPIFCITDAAYDTIVLLLPIASVISANAFCLFNDFRDRRGTWMRELKNARRALLDSPAIYYDRLLADFSAMVDALALSAKKPFLREITSIGAVVGSAMAEHVCPVGEDCNVCQAVDEALRLRKNLQLTVCSIEEKKKNLLSRAAAILEAREQAERKQFDKQEEEKRLLEEIRQQVNQELQLPVASISS